MSSVSSARERSDRAGGAYSCGGKQMSGEKQNPKIYVCNNMILNKMITKIMIFNTKTDHLYYQLLSLYILTVMC